MLYNDKNKKKKPKSEKIHTLYLEKGKTTVEKSEHRFISCSINSENRLST